MRSPPTNACWRWPSSTAPRGLALPAWTRAHRWEPASSRPPPGCDNVPVVARRVVRLAGEGLDVDAISLQVEYADAWYDLDATDLPRTGPEGAAVELVVAFDATSQLSNEAEARWTGIAEACPGHVAIFRLDVREHAEVAESYGVRSTPTAFVNGYRVRGSQQAEAYLRLVRAELGDRGLSCQG